MCCSEPLNLLSLTVLSENSVAVSVTLDEVQPIFLASLPLALPGSSRRLVAHGAWLLFYCSFGCPFGLQAPPVIKDSTGCTIGAARSDKSGVLDRVARKATALREALGRLFEAKRGHTCLPC